MHTRTQVTQNKNANIDPVKKSIVIKLNVLAPTH